MSDITANVVVGMPSQLFTMARSFKANANGQVYIGQIDTDPVNPANQIPVYLENEDGSHVQVSQPISINSGGFPVYNGQLAKFVTVQGYSMAVYDAYGAQQFYFPNVLKYNPDQLEQRLASTSPGLGDALIGVKQPFPLSTPRNQHQKNAESVYVEDFGAIGDGITDDATAIKAAIDSGAKVINFNGSKTYKVINGFEVSNGNNNVTLMGNGCKIYYPKTTASYYHCIRVRANNILVNGFNIYSDSSLLRDDTGFGVCVDGGNYVTIENNTFSNIAKAAIWCVNADTTFFRGNTISSPKADGIHISNNCNKFNISDNIITGAHDDSIAVVRDTVATGQSPYDGVINGNLVTNSINGHGTVLISCANVTVTGNTYRGLSGPAIGSYFYGVSGSPADEDWARGCIITGNTMEDCGLSPVNQMNACGIFVGALKDCTISNNRVKAAPANTVLGTPAIGILISNALNVGIYDNTIHDSSDYGIGCLDSSAAGKATFDGIWIDSNIFEKIAKDAIHFSPSASEIGQISITNNQFINTPYATSFNRSMIVSKTINNKLVISGNNNHHTTYDFYYDTATCLNVFAHDNTPVVIQSFSPVIAPLSGAWTGTSGVSGYYYQVGSTVVMRISITITGKGTGSGLSVNLPKAAKSGSYPMFFSGRESATGKALNGLFINTSQIQVLDVTNVDPTSSGVAINLSFSYVAA
ncbi:phage tailspike protein [Phytobacter diazotrophicus]|uniref:phage tailspike protein n=1 Tax=Phytobacter diazotrophicus TaxID=395631 RepID=UPI002FFA9A37